MSQDVLSSIESSLTLLKLRSLDGLIENSHYDRCLHTLYKLISNIVNNPTNSKYRSFRKSNKLILDALCDGLTAAMIPEVIYTLVFY
jgi:hypothetical protein